MKKKSKFNSSNTPAVILHNPKFDHNVGGAVRACAAFGSDLVIYTGYRVADKIKNGGKKYRLPREERMRTYRHIELINDQYPFSLFTPGVTPVAVERSDSFEPLISFVHPEHAVYVFGPEDGSLPQLYLKHCHRFVTIPGEVCMNLAVTVNVVLYDRMTKLDQSKIYGSVGG